MKAPTLTPFAAPERAPSALPGGRAGLRCCRAATRSSTRNGELIHLLSIEGLPRDVLTHILDTAGTFLSGERPRGQEGAAAARQERVQPVLREQHAHAHHVRDRRQAPVGRRDQPRHRALVHRPRARALLDTIANLSRDACRHVRRAPQRVGAPLPDRAATVAPHVHVVNAGDGRHAHPTQGLLDMYTIRHYKNGLLAAHGGDRRRHACTRASRAPTSMRSPRSACPRCAWSARRRWCRGDLRADGRARVPRHGRGHARRRRRSSCCSLQNERMSGALLPSAGGVLQDLRADAGQARAGQAGCDRDAPGADQPRRRDRLQRWPTARHSVILPQVTFGIAVRMAVMSHHRRQRSMTKLLITNGRVIDPASGRDETCRRRDRGRPHRRDRTRAVRTSTPNARIDAVGLHRRCRAWSTWRCDCASRATSTRACCEARLAAAAAGGVTSLVCPPDTDPPLDEPGLVEMLKFRARQAVSRAGCFRSAR